MGWVIIVSVLISAVVLFPIVSSMEITALPTLFVLIALFDWIH